MVNITALEVALFSFLLCTALFSFDIILYPYICLARQRQGYDKKRICNGFLWFKQLPKYQKKMMKSAMLFSSFSYCQFLEFTLSFLFDRTQEEEMFHVELFKFERC